MQRRLTSTLVLMAAVAAASGCGEQQQQLPSAPEYHIITGTGSGCDSTHVKQLVNSYFSVPEQQVVRSLLSSMLAQTAFSPTAKSLGFDIMTHVDAVVSAGTAGDPAVGSDLVNHLILCMYNPTTELASYPATFPEDFTVALNQSLHGQFHVKPAFTADTLPVLSRDTLQPFSGVKPSGAGTPWATALSGNTPARVLIYGRPGSTPTTYDWKTLPRDAKFNPQVIVGVCVSSATALLNEDNALLPFADAAFLDPNTCSQTALRSPDGPSMFAQRVIRLGASLFGPRALWAAALSPGGLGGSTGGIHSEFGPSEIDHVKLAFKQQPTSTTVFTKITPAVTVVDTAFLTTGVKKSIPNVTITITAVNNNGKTVLLGGQTTKVTDGTGLTTFDDLTLSKSGGYQLVATGAVGGRSAIPVTQAGSVKFNIAPK